MFLVFITNRSHTLSSILRSRTVPRMHQIIFVRVYGTTIVDHYYIILYKTLVSPDRRRIRYNGSSDFLQRPLRVSGPTAKYYPRFRKRNYWPNRIPVLAAYRTPVLWTSALNRIWLCICPFLRGPDLGSRLESHRIRLCTGSLGRTLKFW